MIHNVQDSRRVDPNMPDSDRRVIDGGDVTYGIHIDY